MDDARLGRLLEEGRLRRLSRRELLRRGAALGFSASALAGLAAATAPRARAQDAANPLGVDAGSPLEILMWKAGWGDEYALNAVELYKAAFPGVEVEYQATQRVLEAAQPRFVGGNPPDVIEATLLDRAALVGEGQLAEMTDLLDAPAAGTPGAKLKETLLPNSQIDTVVEGKQYGVNFTFGLNGIWHSEPVMQQKGWEYPTTWDGMLALCEEIKGSGLAPWTYQGKYPGYMVAVMWELVWKQSGLEAVVKVDNLEADAWRQPAVQQAAEALYRLAERDYILSGTEGLTHTESQAEWLNGKSAFIPCGTWLENEMKDLIPEGFNMAIKPVPPLAGATLPFEGVSAFVGQPFVVPSQANNVPGGKEFIRLLFSRENARAFSEYTRALTTVVGAADGLDLGSAFNSANAAQAAAGPNTFSGPLYGSWYSALTEEVDIQMGALLTKRIDPEEFVTRAQAKADEIAADDSIVKFTREP